MSFPLTAEQEALRAKARELADGVVAERAARWDAREEYPWDNVKDLVAVANALSLSPELMGVLIIVDTVVAYTWMGFLISFAARQESFDRWNKADRTAVEGVDYRLVFDGAVKGLGTITFPPGVREKTFTVSALKGAGTQKTLVIGLTHATGPAPVTTGDNSVAKITINARAR
jgi:hypothetical protein